jgi:hypothetical protein
VTDIPPQNYARKWASDSRPDLPLIGDERSVLNAYLDWHRATFELKCAGLTPQQLAEKSVAPSGLTLHGLVRHLAAVERWWVRLQFAGEDVPMLYYSDEDPDQDFTDLSGDVRSAFAVWEAECARSREIVAAARSLEETGIQRRTGQPISLRVILVKLIAEYAQHNGHADLLRERIDGATGH